jgi:uncharacterized protein YjbI with pentapeptide repeats
VPDNHRLAVYEMIELRHRTARRRLVALDLETLAGARLSGEWLAGADVRGRDLRGADLRWANLEEADLRGADLRGAKLWGANMAQALYDGETRGLSPLLVFWEDCRRVRSPGEVVTPE